MATSNAMAAEALIGWAEKLRTASSKFILLNVPTTSTGVAFSGNVGTTAAAQTWTTGTRVRFNLVNLFGAPSIAPLNTTTDYFLIADSATTYRIASTAANAASGTALTVPDFATGNYNLGLAQPTADWSVAELVAYELTHPQYDRLEVPATLPAVTYTGNVAVLELALSVITNSSATPFAYNAIAVIKNGGADGTTTGTVLEALSLTAVSIVQGAPQSIGYRLTMD